MFNVINIQDLEAFLDGQADVGHLPRPLVRQALQRPLLRQRACLRLLRCHPKNPPPWLTRERFDAGRFFAFSEAKLGQAPRLVHQITEIVRWLRQCQTREAPWLHDRLPDGRWRRLMNAGSLDQVLAIVRKDKARTQILDEAPYTRGGGVHIADSGTIRPVLALADGSRWVQLCDYTSMKQEGIFMRNCLRDMERYFADYQVAGKEIYSLRDPRNRPRINVEIHHGTMVQCKGPANSAVPERYDETIGDLLLELAARRCYLVRDGFFIIEAATKRRIMDLRNPPPTGEVNGNLRIDADSFCSSLPSELQVFGNMTLFNCLVIESLPPFLSVHRDLTITSCERLREIGERVAVGGDMRLSGTNDLITIDGPLIVNGSLTLMGCFRLTTIHRPLKVLGDVTLTGAFKLRTLPEGSEIGGNLDIRLSGFARFPANLSIGGAVIVESERHAHEIPKKFNVIIEPRSKGGSSGKPAV